MNKKHQEIEYVIVSCTAERHAELSKQIQKQMQAIFHSVKTEEIAEKLNTKHDFT